MLRDEGDWTDRRVKPAVVFFQSANLSSIGTNRTYDESQAGLRRRLSAGYQSRRCQGSWTHKNLPAIFGNGKILGKLNGKFITRKPWKNSPGF